MTHNAPLVVRVFVSSTFRDMDGERELLMKFVAPELGRRCRARGVTLVLVDLRWGVTEAQAENGEVVDTCLNEIDRCSYFIGFLGHRHGWVPEHFTRSQLHAFPWLAEQHGASLTELEMLHGALPEHRRSHAIVFLRQDDGPAAHGSTADARTEVPPRSDRLADLKDRIRASGLRSVQTYSSVEELGPLVIDSFWQLLNEEFPATPHREVLDEERWEHDVFAQSRFDIYIPREHDLEALTQHVVADGPPLVLYGESGLGKSALLTNWYKQFTADRPAEVEPILAFVTHFVGATGESSDLTATLRRLINELKREVRLECPIPDDASKMPDAYRRCLRDAAAKGRIVILLDAVDQLDDQGELRTLAALFPDVPAQVRLIVSTAAAAHLDFFSARGWTVMRLASLGTTERDHLLVQYLARQGKRLDSARARRIVEHEQTSNPLFLRVLLDELKLYGDHDTLDAYIDQYLTATTPQRLFEFRLQRLEQDYDSRRPALVRDAFSLIASARGGLAEAELLQLLGSDDHPLPQSVWSPLYLAAETSFIAGSRVIRFCHPQLQRAVAHRYLSDAEHARQRHLTLAAFFERRIGDYVTDVGPNDDFMAGSFDHVWITNHVWITRYESDVGRHIREAIWQLRCGGDWAALADLLGKTRLFNIAARVAEWEVHRCWTEIERHSDRTALETYRKVLDDPKAYESVLWPLSALLKMRGYRSASFTLLRYLAQFHSQGKYERDSESGAILNLGHALFEAGDLEGALTEYKRGVDVCQPRAARSEYDADSLASALLGQANVALRRHEHADALRLFGEARDLASERGFHAVQARCLAGIAHIRRDESANIEELLQLYQEQERLYLLDGDEAALAACKGNLGDVLLQSDPASAAALFEQAYQTYSRLGLKSGMAYVLCLKANALDQGWESTEEDQALSLFEQAEQLFQEADDRPNLLATQAKRARILNRKGRHTEAIELLQQHSAYLRNVEDWPGVVESLGREIGVLGNRARLAATTGSVADARSDYERAETLWAEITKIGSRQRLDGVIDMRQVIVSMSLLHDSVPACICERAVKLASSGALEECLEAVRTACDLLRRENLGRLEGVHDSPEADSISRRAFAGMANTLASKALTELQADRVRESLALSDAAEMICRELGARELLQAILCNSAIGLEYEGRWEEAFTKRQEEVSICRTLHDAEGLRMALEGFANACMHHGHKLTNDANHAAALAWYERADPCMRELGNANDLAFCLNCRSRAILASGGDARNALTLAEEGASVCRTAGIGLGLSACLLSQAQAQGALGNRAAAARLHKEAVAARPKAPDDAR